MEATFVMRPEELTLEWLEQLKSRFANDGTITIQASGPEKVLPVDEQRAVNQRAILSRLRETQKKYPPKTIAAEIDINKLIDDMYWQGNH